MATVEKLVTAERLWELPEAADGARLELFQGELIEMTPAGGKHGKCCGLITAALVQYAKGHGAGHVATNDTGIFLERDPDTVLGPDLVYWSRARLAEMPEGFVQVPPDLVVEVVSPSDTQNHAHRKVLHYLDHGVRAVWVVDPATETVMVYRSRQEIRVLSKDDEISAPDVLPGFSCRVGEFFQ
jgi:Uma2 family endonuclease